MSNRKEAIGKVLECVVALESIIKHEDLENSIAALNILNTHSHNTLSVFLTADLHDAAVKQIQQLVKRLHSILCVVHGAYASSALSVVLKRAVEEMDRCCDDLLDGEPN